MLLWFVTENKSELQAGKPALHLPAGLGGTGKDRPHADIVRPRSIQRVCRLVQPVSRYAHVVVGERLEGEQQLAGLRHRHLARAAEPGNDPIQEVTEALQSLDDAGLRLEQIEAEAARIAGDDFAKTDVQSVRLSR